MGRSVTKLVNSVEPINNLAKDNVSPIQPARDNSRNKELGPIGVWPGIGHGKKTRLRVLERKVLIREFSAVAIDMSARDGGCTPE